MSVAARIELEKKVVRGLIRHMKGAGWLPFRVNDGEEMVYVEASESAAMSAVFSVDEASLRFVPAIFFRVRPDIGADAKVIREWRSKCIDAEHGVLIVLGNDGYDAISDWNYSEGDADGFNAAMDAYSDKISAKYG
jgi:hypothetical protein